MLNNIKIQQIIGLSSDDTFCAKLYTNQNDHNKSIKLKVNVSLLTYSTDIYIHMIHTCTYIITILMKLLNLN